MTDRLRFHGKIADGTVLDSLVAVVEKLYAPAASGLFDLITPGSNAIWDSQELVKRLATLRYVLDDARV